MEQQYNPDTARIYHFRYMREYRAVCVLWAVLTIIWATFNVVVFVQPQWIGDSPESPGYGHHGVYKYCYPDNLALRYQCDGSFTDFNSILNDQYKATTFFVGVSALLMLISVAALLLFFCFKKTAVFILVGILELVTAIFMFLACVIYPAGWDNKQLMEICGESSGPYNMGKCNIRWAYILAILGIFDAAILAVLAFFLASKRAKIEMYSSSAELNGFGAETMSKRSMPIQPAVLAVPSVHHDPRESYSEYSQVQKRPGSQSNFNL
ncbi:LHPL4-like protein [Mya arenaria]|uniref:LHPL4-like protein n=1 Tax=Mya arenaria TaxID=6604 RepID=A0ABY7G3C6_MYAAR|nr:LHPL4-like protein [Mya arenaria]